MSSKSRSLLATSPINTYHSNMNNLRTISVPTPYDDFHMIIDSDETVRASGFGSISDLIKRLPQNLRSASFEQILNHPYYDLVQSYFHGDDRSLDQIPRTQEGSNFQRSIWQAMSNISYGQTLSYQKLAQAAGYPTAVRAAGTACGQNRLALLIPCHRILRSDGSIGNYFYGSDIKKFLLQHEHAI